MNCRDSESLILAERDGVLTKEQHAALSDHVAACPACRQLRAEIAGALHAYAAGLAAVRPPDAGGAWRELQNRLRQPAPHPQKRPLAPVIRFGAPLVAAAAVALAFFLNRPALPGPVTVAELAAPAMPPPPLHDPSFIAGADYVEAGDPEAAVMVFVDKESGWLVVWAAAPESDPSG